MRYFYMFLFWCLFVGTTTAQEGLKLGVYLTPALTFPSNPQDVQQGLLLQQQSAFSYNGGALVGYGISEVVSLSTGIGFHQFAASYKHRRQTLPDGRTDPNTGARALKRAQYLRVPILFGWSTDPNRRWGLIGRIGVHFNFLVDAVYYDERLIGYSNYYASHGIDLQQPLTLYQINGDGTGLMRRGGKAPVYQEFIAGLTAEFGLQIRLNDALKITVMIHAETSSNPEDEGAASLAHNLHRGDYLVTANPLVDHMAAQKDAVKQQADGTPFETIFPNYSDPNQPYETERSPTWNTLVGLQIGIVYTLKN